MGDKNQPRHPAGSEKGGQWAKKTVYHGSRSAFKEFRKGKPIWTTENPNLANEYANRSSKSRNAGPNIKPFKVDVKNPAILPGHMGQKVSISELETALGITLNTNISKTKKHLMHRIVNTRKFATALRKAGYDAVGANEEGAQTWGVLDSKQLTSTFKKGKSRGR